MPSTYTTSLRVERQATGENLNSWGSLLNSNTIDLLDEAIAGVVAIAMPNVDYTLGDVAGASAEVRRPVVRLTGTAMTAQRKLIVPARPKSWVIDNRASFPVEVQVAGGTGLSVVVKNGQAESVYSDGVDVRRASGLTTSVADAINARAPAGAYALTTAPNTWSAVQTFSGAATISGSPVALVISSPSSTNIVQLTNSDNLGGAIFYANKELSFWTSDSGGLAVRRLTMDAVALRSEHPFWAVSSGTASAPVFSFSGDSNSGFYSAAADEVAIATGGSERVRFNAAGVTVAAGGGVLIGARDLRDVGQLVVSISSYTLALSDRGGHLIRSAAGAAALTIPANATVSFPIGSAVALVAAAGGGGFTITPAGGVTLLQAGTGASGARTLGVNGVATLLKTGTDTWYISGTGVT